jgi:hypothetical protein
MLGAEHCWHAICTRDATQDGAFVFAYTAPGFIAAPAARRGDPSVTTSAFMPSRATLPPPVSARANAARRMGKAQQSISTPW